MLGCPDDLLIIRSDGFKRFPVNAPYVQNLLRKTGHEKIGELRKCKRFVSEVETILEGLLFNQPSGS